MRKRTFTNLCGGAISDGRPYGDSYRKRFSLFVVDKLFALLADGESLKILIATLPSCVAYCPEPDFGYS
jgi:hypothetical protein